MLCRTLPIVAICVLINSLKYHCNLILLLIHVMFGLNNSSFDVFLCPKMELFLFTKPYLFSSMIKLLHTHPGGPGGPGGPVGPRNPCGPISPFSPCLPLEPVLPGTPLTPLNPFGPCFPLFPGEPVSPIDPGGPFSPRGP